MAEKKKAKIAQRQNEIINGLHNFGTQIYNQLDQRRQTTELTGREREDRRVFALVVDDSITVRRVTQRLLERNGMRVLTARDGMDALTLLQEHTPDIILLDIEMPRMDGYEVAAHVRNDPRLNDIPIVMITSRVGEKHRARHRARRQRLPRQTLSGESAARCD